MTCPTELIPADRLYAGRRWVDVVFDDPEFAAYVANFDPSTEISQAARAALKIYFDSTEGDADE